MRTLKKEKKENKILNRIKFYLNPIPLLKYTLAFTKRHKWLFAAAFFVVVWPALCIPMDWADPTKSMDFIGSVENLEVTLSDPLVGDVAQTIFEALVPAGQSLAILFWFVSLSEIAFRTDLEPQHLILQFLKITLFLAVLDNGWFILSKLFDFFNETYTTVVSKLTVDTLGGTTLKDITLPITFDSFHNGDVRWYDFGIIIEFAAYQIFRLFCLVSTSLQVWARKLKLLVFASLAPIGVADFVGGSRSGSIRYIKNLTALGIQGAVMYIISILGQEMIIHAVSTMKLEIPDGTTETDYFQLYLSGSIMPMAFLIAAVPVALAMIALFNKSEEISKQLIN